MDYIREKRYFFDVISVPIILSVFVPIVILDIWVEVYHRICFPLYGLKYIKRADYIKIDRHKLKYLRWYQKIGCAYCGYANGIAGYWVAIVGRTEKYWCGIRHEKKNGFREPEYEKDFVEYGDKDEFIDKYVK